MAVVRDRRQLNLRLPLPEPSERCSRFPPPLPPSAAAAAAAAPSATAISAADLEKLQVLGHGNGGTVYKVRHKQTSAIYALKVVHGDSDPAVRRQVLREVSILRRTDSPHVIKCHGVFDLPGGDIAFCMQYMDMGTLETLLKNDVVFTETLLARICRQILSGLEYLGGRHICVVADEESKAEYVEAMRESGRAAEVVVGSPEEAMEGLEGIDFLVADWRRNDLTRILRAARLGHRGAVVVCKNATSTAVDEFRWRQGKLRIVRSVFLPVGNGLHIAHVGAAAAAGKGQSRWIKHIDRRSGEEIVFRR